MNTSSFSSTTSSWLGSPSPSKISQMFSSPQSSPVPPPQRHAPTPLWHGVGYFALSQTDRSMLFDPTFLEQERQEEEAKEKQKQEEEEQRKREEELAWEAHLERQKELRQRRLAIEAEEARKGEEDWVRSGGLLRDANGNRDYARTEAIREELRIREVEKRLKDRWENHESRWAELLYRRPQDGALKFSDIPWPVELDGNNKRTPELKDFTVARVEEFLLGPLRVRGETVTKKERVRSSLLRWHPDKMTNILAKVAEEDLSAVKDGISAITVCLQQLNSRT